MRKYSRIFVAVTGAAMLAFGIVWAASAAPSKDRPASIAKQRQTASISAFRQKFRPTRMQRRQQRQIGRMIRRSPRASIAATADASVSRPIPIAGYGDSLWIVRAEDGAVCTFIPDPVDGWGSSCATAKEVAAGAALTMLGGGSTGPLQNGAIVAVVVPDHAEGPVVEQPNGSVDALEVTSNVAAAVVSPGALVRSGRVAVTVPNPRPPDCSPRADGSGSEDAADVKCAL